MPSIRDIQKGLQKHGYDPGPIDGIMGPRTERAIVAFKAANGLRKRPYVGPITLRKLGLQQRDPTELPWINEVARYLGLHEVRDYTTLSAWLKSDGQTLGDPRVLPWCGDLVETAIKLTLPDEPFRGRVGANPYVARNWLDFGVDVGPRYGAVVVFWRGSPKSLSGHVGFAIGYDPKRNNIRCRGGNQSNSVSDTWISSNRLLGYRWPRTYKGERPQLPVMDSTGAIISTNEV